MRRAVIRLGVLLAHKLGPPSRSPPAHDYRGSKKEYVEFRQYLTFLSSLLSFF